MRHRMLRTVLLTVSAGLLLLACNGGGGGAVNQVFAPLDRVVFNEKFSCSQTYTSQAPFCADSNDTSTIRFFYQGDRSFHVRDEPESGFVLNGAFRDADAGAVFDFDWQATSPTGYFESGTWHFDSSLQTFSGDSHYVAVDGTYTGDCLEEGTRFGNALPPDTGPIGACP